MAFTGNEGEQITLQEGAEYTARYRASKQSPIKGVFFGRNHIEQILGQAGCVGLRMYFAQESDGSSTLVMVGADSNQNDMLDLIFERAVRCPAVCSIANPLNSDLAR